jgi:hypothetical protein
MLDDRDGKPKEGEDRRQPPGRRPEAIGLVITGRLVPASPRFWRLRDEWADLTQETVAKAGELRLDV